MIHSREEILALMDAKACPYQLYEHAAVFTVEEALRHCAHIPGAHVKNLFLRNKKKSAYWLITVKEDKRIDLMALGELLEGGRLSFGSENDLIAMLGVKAGSVTPLAIVNDKEKRIKLFFDRDLMQEPGISVHPLDNSATVHLRLEDLLRFIQEERQERPDFIDLPVVVES